MNSIMIGNVLLYDLAVIVQDTLILGDVHLGYEEALAKKGLLIPKTQIKDLIERIKRICSNHKFRRIVLLGDIKHEFGRISEQEWGDAIRLFDFLKKNCDKLILIKGNHDSIISPIAKKISVRVMDSYSVGGAYLIHGDKLPNREDEDYRKASMIIMGHEHPAISVREQSRIERYKCFLVGKYDCKRLIVVPSFFFMTEGTDVLHEELLSPLLRDVDDFEVYAVADKIYNFGRIGRLRRINS